MSSERNIDVYAALILVISIIGLILIAAFAFAGLYYTGPPSPGNRYSCLFGCEYWTVGDLIAQIFMIIFLILQIVIVINELVPKRFIEKDLTKYGLGLAALTILMVIIGIASFGVTYDPLYNWWPETGFYGGIIAGIINTILFFLKYRSK